MKNGKIIMQKGIQKIKNDYEEDIKTLQLIISMTKDNRKAYLRNLFKLNRLLVHLDKDEIKFFINE